MIFHENGHEIREQMNGVCVCVCVIRFTQKHNPKSHPSPPPTCFTLTLTHPTWETRPARGTDNIRVDLAPVPFFRNEEE